MPFKYSKYLLNIISVEIRVKRKIDIHRGSKAKVATSLTLNTSYVSFVI